MLPQHKKVSVDVARTFFKTVLPQDIPEGLTLPIWAKEGKGTYRVSSVEQILELLDSKREIFGGLTALECNIYFGQLQRPSVRGRGTDADTAAVFMFGKDIDIKGPGHANENLPETVGEALDLLYSAIPLRPTVVWMTGGGIQAGWVLKDPFMTVEDGDLAFAQSIALRIQTAFDVVFKAMKVHIDSTPDIGRVLRIPGSYNWKGSNPQARTTTPKFVELLEVNPDLTYSIEQIERVLPRSPNKRSQGNGAKAGISLDQAREMLKCIPPQMAYEEWLKVLMALHAEFGDAGIELAEEWSPGTPGEVAAKFRSFHGRDGVSGKSLVFFAERHGYILHADAALEDGLSATRTINTRYIGDLQITKRVTIVKSARGTGKTEALSKELIADGRKVINIGHRRALLRNLSSRLDTDFYMDIDEAHKSRRLSICVNSLPRLINESRCEPADIVTIDEFEQVLAHLTGAEFAGKRDAVMQVLSYLLRRAKQVVLLDADMSWVGYQAIKSLMGIDDDDIDVLVNSHNPGQNTALEYRTSAELMAQMVEDLTNGRSLFVASNSRNRCDYLTRTLKRRFPDMPILTITQENSQDPEVQEIVGDINERITAYKVLITSPALGTGVSIDVEHFDACYAIGEHGVTTAMDFCQQMARVRTLKSRELHFYVAPAYGEPANSDVESLKAACVDNAAEHDLVFRISDEGDVVPVDTQYLDLWAWVHARQNASRNFFRQHTRQILRTEGHTLQKAGDIDIGTIMAEYQDAREEVRQEWITMVVEAPVIDSLEASFFQGKHFVPREEQACLTKHIIASTYGMDVDEELVEKHEAGLYAQFVSYMDVIGDGEAAAKSDKAEATYGRSITISPDGKVTDCGVGKRPLAHRQFRSLKRNIRREILEKSGLGLDFSGVLTNEELLNDMTWLTWCQANMRRVPRVLGISMPQKPGISFLGRLLEQFGLVLTADRVKRGGKHRRVYRVHHEALEYLELLRKHQEDMIKQDSMSSTVEWIVTRAGIQLRETTNV